jgi:hypothetical protein
MGPVWILPEDAQEYGRVFDAWLKATGEATVFACALKDLLLADILADRGVDVDGVRRRGPRPVGGDAAAGPFEGRTVTVRVVWTPKGYARHLLALRGQSTQWGCLEALWQRESGWNPRAHNPSSGAHGIPQALPGSKMGPGWWSDFKVQIRWGLAYLRGRYGGPCGGWAHSQAVGWY